MASPGVIAVGFVMARRAMRGLGVQAARRMQV